MNLKYQDLQNEYSENNIKKKLQTKKEELSKLEGDKKKKKKKKNKT